MGVYKIIEPLRDSHNKEKQHTVLLRPLLPTSRVVDTNGEGKEKQRKEH